MNISAMRTRVELYEPVEEFDSIGGSTESLVLRKTCWAEFLRPRFGNSTVQGDAEVQVITQGIRMRPTQVERGWQIIAKDHTYEVLHVDNSKPDEIIITAQEVNH